MDTFYINFIDIVSPKKATARVSYKKLFLKKLKNFCENIRGETQD